MKNPKRILIPLLPLLLIVAAAGEKTEPESGSVAALSAYPSLALAAPDTIPPATPETLATKAIPQSSLFLERAKHAARTVRIVLRVGKRLLDAWVDSLLSPPARRG